MHIEALRGRLQFVSARRLRAEEQCRALTAAPGGTTARERAVLAGHRLHTAACHHAGVSDHRGPVALRRAG
eukprot:8587483-Pyramimonas_sp.AAC.1